MTGCNRLNEMNAGIADHLPIDFCIDGLYLRVLFRVTVRELPLDVKLLEHGSASPIPARNGRFHLAQVSNLLYESDCAKSPPHHNAQFPRVDQIEESPVLTRSESDTQDNTAICRQQVTGSAVIHRLGVGSEAESLVAQVLKC